MIMSNQFNMTSIIRTQDIPDTVFPVQKADYLFHCIRPGVNYTVLVTHLQEEKLEKKNTDDKNCELAFYDGRF